LSPTHAVRISDCRYFFDSSTFFSNPATVGQLSRFQQAVAKVPQLNIRVLTIPESLVETAAGVSQQTGLLSNDALIVAVMQANGLVDLASHDADFDRVPGLKRYAPA
jgi:predicted nucleic acid-binding protein